MADDVQNTMKPIAPNDQDKFNQQIIQFRVDPDTGFYTLSCSTDNGLHYQVILTADGRKFSDKDAASFWPFLKKYVSSLIDGATIEWADIKGKPEVITKDQLEERLAKLAIPTSFSWNDITDKPKLALKDDIPSLDGYAKLTDIPSVAGLVKEAELADYAKLTDVPKSMSWSQVTDKPILALKSDIPNVSGFLKQADLAGYAKKTDIPSLDDYAKKTDIPKDPDLSVYAKKTDIPSLDGYAKMSDLPSVTGLVKQTDLVGYAKLSDIPKPPDLTPYAKTSEVDEVKATADSALSKAEEAQSTADANSKALSVKANKSEIPDISGLAKKSDIPVLPDLNSYALKSELPSLSGYARLSDIPSVAGLVKEAELADYAKKSDIPAPVDLSGYAKTDAVDAVKTVADKAQSTAEANSKALADKADRNELPVVPTDLVHTAEMEQVKETANQAVQTASQAMSTAKSAKPAIDTSDEFTVKKPSEYPEGFSYELKEVFELIPDRSNLDVTAQEGYQAIVTTEACQGYARQTVKVIDSERPLTFIRNGYGSTWYPFEQINTWSV